MIRAEFRKLLTVRSTWLLLGLAQLVVVGGVSGLMSRRDDPPGALAHVGLVALFSLLLGILSTAGEYRHRTITDSFLAVPVRSRLLAAKLAVLAAAGLLFGLVAAVVALVTTALWASGMPSGVGRTVAGGIAWNVAFAVLGVGLGALITNLMAAVATALAWLALIEGIVAQLIGGAGQWLPFALGLALENRGGPPQWQAATVMAGYAVAFATAGILFTGRRDIT